MGLWGEICTVAGTVDKPSDQVFSQHTRSNICKDKEKSHSSSIHGTMHNPLCTQTLIGLNCNILYFKKKFPIGNMKSAPLE